MSSFASSYIKTVTTAVTRNADVLTYSSAGNFSGVVGAAYAEATSKEVAGTQVDIIDLVNVGNPHIPLVVKTNDKLALLDTSTTSLDFNTVTPRPFRTPIKFGSTWGTAGTTGTYNGTTPPALQTYTGGAATNPISIGGRSSAVAMVFGTIRNVRIWQRALSSAELQAITS